MSNRRPQHPRSGEREHAVLLQLGPGTWRERSRPSALPRASAVTVKSARPTLGYVLVSALASCSRLAALLAGAVACFPGAGARDGRLASMRGSVVFIIGSSFLDEHSHQLTALLTLVLTVVFAWLANRGVSRWAARADLNPAVDTRVRFIRRLITLGICLLGVLFALSQFGGLNKLAAGVLASSAIIAAIVGFAARQTLANLIAGVMLTIAQPLRIGDQVTILDQTGVVEDVRLNYTVLRTTEGRRLLIRNERLASEMIRNDTILDDRVRPEASVWLTPASDTDIAVSSIT